MEAQSSSALNRGMRLSEATYCINGTHAEKWSHKMSEIEPDAEWIECYNCEDGYSHHECGDDTCVCLNPVSNVVCDICDGKAGWWAPVGAGLEE